MSEEFNQETIDQYLSKSLKGETLAAFESKMNADPIFKKEVETQAFINRGVNKFGEDEMRKKLKKIRAEVLSEKGETNKNKSTENPKGKVVSLSPKKKINPILRWSVAAGVALAIGAAFYLFSTRENLLSTFMRVTMNRIVKKLM